MCRYELYRTEPKFNLIIKTVKDEDVQILAEHE